MAVGQTRRRTPTLRTERGYLRDGVTMLAGMDEVGRGALAGPVSVGVVVIGERSRTAPAGVRDSKLMSPAQRELAAPRIRRWALAHAVGHAGPEEIDAMGIIAALRLAGRRALAALDVIPDLVILDGAHDWLTAPEETGLLAYVGGLDGAPSTPPVSTMVKADLRCSSVAAASVLAKVERDAMMTRLAVGHPGYGWELNKGYAAPDHLAALARLGATPLHRRSWNLPGEGRERAAMPRPAGRMSHDGTTLDKDGR
jgi:ribonuclease HII